MQVISGIQSLSQSLSGSVVTIGNFDGVHRGHQQLLQTVAQEARRFRVPAVVYTFDPHPVKILRPQQPTHRIFDLRDQAEQMHKLGIDLMVVESFTRSFSQNSATAFLQDYIVDKLRPKTLVVGHDFSFGSQREGNIAFLEKFTAQLGIHLIVIPPYEISESIVSSTRIRNSLKQGQVEEANSLLGRSYYVRGQVEKGFQRGRTIGVPTANIHPDVEFVPRHGVYCSLAKVGPQAYPAITNIGVNPTFVATDAAKPIKIETHIFDFDESLYGSEIEVHLLHFLRDEQKFNGPEQLKEQIQQDIKQARGFFHARNQNS